VARSEHHHEEAAVATTTISLPDDQLARLRLHAAMKGRKLDEVVRDAVEAYLASLPDLPTPRVIEPEVRLPDAEWQARFDAVAERIRQAGPTDLTPDEIEREITLAREEARRIMSFD
jgi:hypothetical protein